MRDPLLSLRIADSFLLRFLGLHAQGPLHPDEGLLLIRCSAVHTLFLRRAIDVVFLDQHGQELRCARSVLPWRFVCALGSHYTIELPAGYCSRHPDYLSRIHVAMRLRVCPPLSV